MAKSSDIIKILKGLTTNNRQRLESILDTEPRLSNLLSRGAINSMVSDERPLMLMDPSEFSSISSQYDLKNLPKRSAKLQESILSRQLRDLPELGFVPLKSDPTTLAITRHNGRGRASAFSNLDSLLPVRTALEPLPPWYDTQFGIPKDLQDAKARQLPEQDLPINSTPEKSWPTYSLEETLDLLRNSMNWNPEDDSLKGITKVPRKAQPFAEGGSTNKSLNALRQVAASLAGLVPGVNDQSRKKVEDHIARVLSGTGSQVLGLNEFMEPELGKRPGIIDEVTSLPGLAPSLLQGSGAIADLLGSRYGSPHAGDTARRLAELAEKHLPDEVSRAAARTDLLHQKVREGVGLPETHGFTENAEDALGVMAGQLPVPGSLVRKLTGSTGRASKLAKTVAESPLEWFSPTIDPKLSNYLSGAGFGGTIGSVADAFAEPVQEKAEGGRVRNLSKMLETLSLNPSATTTSTAHLLEDPLENVKYASYEANQAGKLSPENQASFNAMIEKYLSGDTSTTDEALADRLIDLHRTIFGGPPLESPTNVITPKTGRELVPEAYGILKKARGGTVQSGRLKLLKRYVR